jgi:2-oxo-4-hydroxy-4-carboxy-5-ureidoimidazoline decarboxylase
MSASYGARCGFPFIICARRHTPSSVLTALELRLGAPVAAERLAALAEIFFITRLRVVARVTGPGIPRTTGHLSTQVLTVNRTRPAPSMRVELLRDGKPIIDCIVAGDSEYRLIWEEPLRIGQHELRFYLGKCFANQFPPTPGAPACNVVAINFVVTEPEGHYHLPLLVPY